MARIFLMVDVALFSGETKVIFLLMLILPSPIPVESEYFVRKENYILIDLNEGSVYCDGIYFRKITLEKTPTVKVSPEQEGINYWDLPAKYLGFFRYEDENKAWKNINSSLKEDYVDFVIKYRETNVDKYGGVRVHKKYVKFKKRPSNG